MSLLASVIFDKNISYRPQDIRGIENLRREEVLRLKAEGKRIKLLVSYKDGRVEVSPKIYSSDHIFYRISGPEKILHIVSDSLGEATLIGGKSDLRGVAASLHRDLVLMEDLNCQVNCNTSC